MNQITGQLFQPNDLLPGWWFMVFWCLDSDARSCRPYPCRHFRVDGFSGLSFGEICDGSLEGSLFVGLYCTFLVIDLF